MDFFNSLLALLGIGAIINSLVIYSLNVKKRKREANQDFKEKRYKAILILAYSRVFYSISANSLKLHRPDIASWDKLQEELFLEWQNMLLYANDAVIIAMRDFLQKTDFETLSVLCIEMRKDLYGLKTKLKPTDLLVKINKNDL